VISALSSGFLSSPVVLFCVFVVKTGCIFGQIEKVAAARAARVRQEGSRQAGSRPAVGRQQAG